MKRLVKYTLELVRESSYLYEKKTIRSPQDAYDIATDVLDLMKRPEEELWVLSLNTKNDVTGMFMVSRGSLNSSIVHPREVFKGALLNNAASIIAVHQHPSGNSTPSREDIEVTKRLAEAGKILGIELLDHIVIGEGEYVSLKEKGYV